MLGVVQEDAEEGVAVLERDSKVAPETLGEVGHAVVELLDRLAARQEQRSSGRQRTSRNGSTTGIRAYQRRATHLSKLNGTSVLAAQQQQQLSPIAEQQPPIFAPRAM